MMTTLALLLAALPALAETAWQVESSSTAALAAEHAIVYRGAPLGLAADPAASASDDVLVVKAVENDGAWTWTVLPVSTGALSFAARYRAADGSALQAPPVSLKVGAPDLPQNSEIIDILQPLKARPALWPLLLAAALGYAAWRGWRYWQSRRVGPDGEPIPDVPPVPPDVAAAEAIAKLLASGLWQTDQAAYYLRLTDILRAYLEARYRQPVTAMTSVEVARLVKDRAQDLRVGGSVRELLSRADLVKFAKAKPEPDEGPRDADLALGVIRDTTPPGLSKSSEP